MAVRERWDDSARSDESPALVSLCTRELDTVEGHTRWVGVFERLYCESDIAWPDPRRRFDADWDGRRFGNLHVSTIQAGAHTVVRSPAMITSDGADDYLVCVVTDGQVEVRQSGRITRLERGAFALLDLSVPFVFYAPTAFRQTVVRAPRELLTSRLPSRIVEYGTAQSISGESGTGRLVGHLLCDVAATDTPVSEGCAVALSSSAVDMLATALMEGCVPTRTAELDHLQDFARVQRAIEAHLHDPDLTLSNVAATVAMSLRSVQKVFAEAGTTPRAWLYRARLERARKLLLTTGLTVAEVSEAAGFRDVSHFSRTFRAAFGASPGQYRKVAADTGASHVAEPTVLSRSIRSAILE
jgi:AraC-like DNA-binding protein